MFCLPHNLDFNVLFEGFHQLQLWKCDLSYFLLFFFFVKKKKNKIPHQTSACITIHPLKSELFKATFSTEMGDIFPLGFSILPFPHFCLKHDWLEITLSFVEEALARGGGGVTMTDDYLKWPPTFLLFSSPSIFSPPLQFLYFSLYSVFHVSKPEFVVHL